MVVIQVRAEHQIIIMLRSPNSQTTMRYISLCYLQPPATDHRICEAVECGVNVINGLSLQIWDAILLNYNQKSIGIVLKYSAFLFYD